MSFELDPFQKEAISWIEKEHSLLVAAPTGSGKTLIAEKAIEKAMERGEKVVYTAPVKALSNQKYRDFRAQYGDEKVGILTGDVSINPDAPIIIMTTEIYRNSLFDKSERIETGGWIIFDEIHYRDDPERGTVWEEAILFTPPEVRILALSATCPNVQQLADWIRSVHDRPIAVIEETHRPVPLDFVFQCQNRFFYDIKDLKREGYQNRDNWRMTWKEKRRGMHMPKSRPNRLDHLLEHLIEKQRLPAIYFAFGRRRTETMAWEAVKFDFLTGPERQKIVTMYDDLLDKYDLTKEISASEMRPLVEHGIAYHHAGMLPTLKEVIEQLFTSRLIKLIFTTETFALGINMPARSVIFDELEKFYGKGFAYLTTRDFYQMAGRAGRRGMDPSGSVYVRLLPHDVPLPEVQRILYARPETIHSQLNTAYATLLNLYRDLGPKLLDIYPRTFHAFQSHHRKQEEGRGLIERKLELLENLNYITSTGVTAKGEFATTLFGYELLLAEMHQEGVLDGLDEASLNVLLAALIYEPRKGVVHPHLHGKFKKLSEIAAHHSKTIYRLESKLRITPYTKHPHFHLANAVESWTRGESFDQMCKISPADEGEIVRYLRMVIQLLREIMHAPHASESLRQRAASARKKINRDVVDAEKQLRV